MVVVDVAVVDAVAVVVVVAVAVMVAVALRPKEHQMNITPEELLKLIHGLKTPDTHHPTGDLALESVQRLLDRAQKMPYGTTMMLSRDLVIDLCKAYL